MQVRKKNNLTSSPTLILFKLHLISNLSDGGVLSGIHWNCATQAMTPKYSTLGLAMSLASRTPGILIFLPPKTPIEFQLVLWVWNQRKSMSEGWHSFKCGMICTVYELEIVNGGGVGGQKMTKTCQRSFWAAINNQKQLWRRLHFPFIFSEEAKILLKVHTQEYLCFWPLAASLQEVEGLKKVENKSNFFCKCTYDSIKKTFEFIRSYLFWWVPIEENEVWWWSFLMISVFEFIKKLINPIH